ncbi:MAG: 1-acyl-sn-glycerol-3-phosphate acyltransferase [Polyangia bacterium]
MNEPPKAGRPQGEQLAAALESIGRWVERGSSALRGFRREVLTDLDRRLEVIARSMGEDGVDPFGLEPASLRRAAIGAAFLYKLYFRCKATGLENVPRGPVILVANHAGQLPIDGVMITAALLLEGDPPRLARSLVDRWVPTIPFVSTFFARSGVAVGSQENAERLLGNDAALLTFPEGMEGITKTVDQAYRLRDFGLGYMRLSLAAGAPVVPVAVVGSEEQYPTLYNLDRLGKIFGLPTLPIWLQMPIPLLGLLPLPVRYRLRFGEPMRFSGDPDDSDAAVRELSSRVEKRIEKMLAGVRAERRSVFW